MSGQIPDNLLVAFIRNLRSSAIRHTQIGSLRLGVHKQASKQTNKQAHIMYRFQQLHATIHFFSGILGMILRSFHVKDDLQLAKKSLLCYLLGSHMKRVFIFHV